MIFLTKKITRILLRLKSEIRTTMTWIGKPLQSTKHYPFNCVSDC